MPDTLLRKDPADLVSAARDAGIKVRDGISNNRAEMTILAGTIAFVVLMAVLGVALISAG